MEWKLDRSRPICPQIVERLHVAIASGELSPGEKLMSVREVALAAGVNPNTVQKSFEELERSGAVYSVRGTGWFVSDDTSSAKRKTESMVTERVAEFFDDMKRLGVGEDDAKKYVNEWKGGAAQ
ncbi:MAG: GntR family transcriptional regulator [Clostridia bacterium]|nr:GntR family transcriptional regulator [Clostridia bacterium]